MGAGGGRTRNARPHPVPRPPHLPDPAPVDLPSEGASRALAEAVAREAPVDGEALREAMRRIVSPVVVVTVESDEVLRGATIGSFTSVSLEPPLVSFNVTRETALHRALVRAERYAVHLLAAEHADLAAHFAIPDLDGEAQLAPFGHRRSGAGHSRS